MYFEMIEELYQSYGVTKWPDLPDGTWGFQSGDLITVDVPLPLVFLVDYTAEQPPTDFVTSFMSVFSERLLAAFRQSGVDNFQAYPAILKNPTTGETWENYQAVNILGKVACADLEHSVYKPFLGDGVTFDELVIDVKKANGALFFRLLESTDKIIVHNHVLDYMYDENEDPIFDGVDFETVKSTHKIKK